MIITDITMPEFTAGLEHTKTVAIPCGSTEEHGTHLPLDTDTMQVYEVLRAVAAQRPLFVAPPVHYGICRSTADHPGTVGIRPDTFRALITDIAAGLYRHGLRDFLLISGHAGTTHMSALVEVGETLLERFADCRVAVACEYHLLARAAAELVKTPDDSHAGEIETARIMHLFPQLVKGTSPREYPAFPRHILTRNKRACWPGGVWGDPSAATPEQGEKLFRLAVDRVADLVDDLEGFTAPAITGA
ncbi:MAG: creatininase family protein [Deltaproteobacteria bacterium]|nr:creatininase family protein [Candidatus Anaeroferrophillacea bacterium]